MAGLALQTVARAARGGQTLVKWGMCNHRRSSRRGPESRWHKHVLGPLCCVLPLCHVSQCHVSRCHVPLFPGLSPRVGHATDHLGPARAFRLAERCISTCISASPACSTGRHHIGRAGCGDAAVQHVGLVCLRHNNTDVQGDHVHTIAFVWVVATAVRGMRRSVRRGAKEEAASLSRCHRQPVSLRRPACLFCQKETLC